MANVESHHNQIRIRYRVRRIFDRSYSLTYNKAIERRCIVSSILSRIKPQPIKPFGNSSSFLFGHIFTRLQSLVEISPQEISRLLKQIPYQTVLHIKHQCYFPVGVGFKCIFLISDFVSKIQGQLVGRIFWYLAGCRRRKHTNQWYGILDFTT